MRERVLEKYRRKRAKNGEKPHKYKTEKEVEDVYKDNTI